MLAILLADLRGTIDRQTRQRLIADLRRVPDLASRCLDGEAQVEKVARALLHTQHCLYLGRGINMPTAYEGALKLKEISYIHAEGYPAGEMKHGPIALIDRNMPVVVLAMRDPWYDKMFSQVKQAKSRGGIVVAVASQGDSQIEQEADHVIWVSAGDALDAQPGDRRHPLAAPGLPHCFATRFRCSKAGEANQWSSI